MGIANVVATNLERLMERARLKGEARLASQNGLARRAKVGQRTIGRILSREQVPSVDVLDAIARAYDLQGWQLMVEEFDPGNPPLLREASETERELWRALEEIQQKMRALERERSHHGQESKGAKDPARRIADTDRAQSRDSGRKKVAPAGRK